MNSYCCSYRLLFINNDIDFDKSPTVTVNPPGITKALSLSQKGGAAVVSVDSLYNLFHLTFLGFKEGSQFRAIYSLCTYNSRSGTVVALNSVSGQNEYPPLLCSAINRDLGVNKVEKIPNNAWNSILDVPMPVLEWKIEGTVIRCEIKSTI